MEDRQKELLNEIAGITEFPDGAYNIRANGQSIGRASTQDVVITPKTDVAGMDIHIAPGTKREHIHIPVVIDESGLVEVVYNDFHIGEGAVVTITAGCGIHNAGNDIIRHDGVHTFYVGKNAKVTYIEKHYATGEGAGERVLNPVTKVIIDEGGVMQMETVQIKGVDSTRRMTSADIGPGASLVVKEKLMTHQSQFAETEFEVNLNGADSNAHVVSRSVAADKSYQLFLSKINGNAKCMGHTECDAIIMDEASVRAVPEITANHVEASLIHEAAIGKIAGEQIMKLMTLGLTEKEAEEQIIGGFLK